MKRFGTAGAIVALAFAAGACRSDVASPDRSKPTVHLISALPLLWGDSFGLGRAAPEAMRFLDAHYRVVPVDLPSQLPKGGVLLAAQPRALPAQELVALDRWVRDGGHLLLLADPLLEWPSERPLGDKLRAPIQYADTGLLAHWGLRLDAPDERGLKVIRSGQLETFHVSPGRLVKIGGQCSVEGEEVVADCSLGEGRVLVVADADWFNLESIRAVGGDSAKNLATLESLLGRLSRPAG